jgi:hypothetical protein
MNALMVAVAIVAAASQEERDLAATARTTAERGFTVSLRPAASAPGFSAGAEALAGAPIRGEYSNGIFHATDGTFEIYRRGSRILVRTEDGWRPFDAVVAPLRGEIAAAFDREHALERGNVTRAREARRHLIRLLHLAHRSDAELLLRLGSAFRESARVRTAGGGAAATDIYEAALTTEATFGLLEGPFERIVENGELAFSGVSGSGRAEAQQGVLKRVHLKATGKYVYHDETEEKSRRGTCALEMPSEVVRLLEAAN